MATFTGSEPVTTLSDNFNFLNNQINDSGTGFTTYAVDTGTASNLVVTLASAPVAYEAGMMVVTKPAFINTGATVINVNALGNVPIVNPANLALVGGELSVNVAVALVYDGTSFRIIGPCPKNVAIGGLTGNTTITCQGYTSVTANLAWTSGTNLTITLQGLSAGVPVDIVVTNGIGSTQSWFYTVTDPAGNAFTQISAYRSGAIGGSGLVNLVSTGITVNSAGAMCFSGMSDGSKQIVFSV